MSGQARSPTPMDPPASRALESLLGFWAEAGVDTAFADEPVDRLAERVRPPPVQLRAPAQAPATPGPDVSGPVEAAPRLAAQAQDLTELAVAIAAFDGCGLKFE